jgi:hypothetical protein
MNKQLGFGTVNYDWVVLMKARHYKGVVMFLNLLVKKDSV